MFHTNTVETFQSTSKMFVDLEKLLKIDYIKHSTSDLQQMGHMSAFVTLLNLVKVTVEDDRMTLTGRGNLTMAIRFTL